MAQKTVEFHFITGIKRAVFRNARLRGSWDANGQYVDEWTESPMQEIIGEDGCPVFVATVNLDHGQTFRWGVVVDGPQGGNFWAIATEIADHQSSKRYREFTAEDSAPQVERYYLTYLRRLGANKFFPANAAMPGLRFSVWAPNAQSVAVVFGEQAGYIDNQGGGIDSRLPVIPLIRQPDDVWVGETETAFERLMSLPYMYRIVNAQGETVYRTDIFSRSQIGRGNINPAMNPSWPGTVETLDGGVSCSVVIDPDLVRRGFESTLSGELPDLIPTEEFWASEFTPGLSVPTRVDDLVIYELHIGSLGFGKPDSTPGDLSDALVFLDHLVDLGINAVELLPMAEFSGSIAWGYGDTHHLCIESSAGGRDKYRHFVRECHRKGIAVIQDVVYNHYDGQAERAEWQYDSSAPEQNIYYWYEGHPSDYQHPDGGYLDNGSTGYTPRFWAEPVRQQFISSAVFLVEEMHVDGLRVDLTQAIHRDNSLHADGRSVGHANQFGQKLFREWSRTLKMIRPSVMLIAEDHTGWDAVTKPANQDGLGFDAVWEVSFYHNLIGDSDMAGNVARLLKHAGLGWNDPLPMDMFSGALYASQYNKVVFHESHDEAGNAGGTRRTMATAVNDAALVGETRTAAEARSKVCFGLSLLSAGTPMFFMGEEIAAQKPYHYNDFLTARENILGERTGNGKHMFRFYQDVISLSGRLHSIRSRNIDILHQSNSNRVIAFKRWAEGEEVIIVASFNDSPFENGYRIRKDSLAIPDAGWKEIFNSDAAIYGGRDIGNFGTTVRSGSSTIEVRIPANGFVVFVKR